MYRPCIRNLACGWLQIRHKSGKKNNDVTIFWHDIKINFFWCCRVFLVKFSYWSKFHVNIMTEYGVMILFIDKGLTRNPEIGNTPDWVLHSIWRLVQVRDTKAGTNVSNEKVLNTANHPLEHTYIWIRAKRYHD